VELLHLVRREYVGVVMDHDACVLHEMQ
jgi:hypothetical protein